MLAELVISVVFGAFAVFSGHKAYIEYRAKRRAEASWNWPSVEGKVNSSRIRRVGNGNDEMLYGRKVTYSYSVMGKHYENWRVGFGESRGNRLEAEWALKAYASEKPVTVFYNPKDPQDAVLEEGESGPIRDLIEWLSYFYVAILFFFCCTLYIGH